MHKRIIRIKLNYNKKAKKQKVHKNKVRLKYFKLLFKSLEYLALLMKVCDKIKKLSE